MPCCILSSSVSTQVHPYFVINPLTFCIFLDENVYQQSSNLFGLVKAFLLKFSVGLIVLQGLIVQFMTVTGSEPYDDDSDYSAEDKTIRGYSK